MESANKLSVQHHIIRDPFNNREVVISSLEEKGGGKLSLKMILEFSVVHTNLSRHETLV